MSDSKLKRLELLKQQLKEVEVNISDPIERIEQKKQLEKEIRKLERSLNQIESLKKEQQALESLRTECSSSDQEKYDNKKNISNFTDNSNTQIDEFSLEESNLTDIPSIINSSESIKSIDASEFLNNSSQEKFNLKYIAIFGIVFSSVIPTILLINFITNQKAEQAKLQELARQQVILAQQETAKAKQQQVEAEQEKQDAILAQQEAAKARQDALQAKQKADNLIQNNLSIESITTTSPIEFIEEHYSNLNDRNYDLTWQHLTPQFQAKSKSFYEYIAWWDSVQSIEIGQIKVLEENSDRAVLNVQLKYFMNNGTVYQDPKSTIYLVWDYESNSWLFADKQ